MDLNIAQIVIVALACGTVGVSVVPAVLPKKKRRIYVTRKNAASYYTPPDLKTKVAGGTAKVYVAECRYPDSKKPEKLHSLRCKEYIYDRLKPGKSYDVLIKQREILKVLNKKGAAL